MKFFSDVLGSMFESVEELESAEAKYRAEKEKKEMIAKEEAEKKAKLEADRKKRAKEVEDAFQRVKEAQDEANKLLNEFCKDYKNFHFTFKGPNVFPLQNSLIDFMLNKF